MNDELLDGLEKSFGPLVKKPDDMSLEDFFKGMRALNRAPFRPECAHRFPYSNGTIWDRFHSRAILTYLGEDSWVMLGFGSSCVGATACVLNAYHWKDGRYLFNHDELEGRLNEQGWKCLGFWDGIEYPEVIPMPAALRAADSAK